MPRDTHVVTPEGWLSRGEAFVRGDGEQLAVFGGIVGEAAKVRVFGQQGQQFRGRVLSVVGAPHPHRVKPACEKWGPCGGCPWMHLSPEGRQAAHDALWAAAAAEAGAALPLSPVVLAEPGSASEILLHWGYSDQGQPRLGVVAREGEGLVAIPRCPKVDPAVRLAMGAVAATLRECDVRPGRDGPVRGIRCRVANGEILLTLRASRPTPVLYTWVEALAANITELRGVVANYPPDTDPKGSGVQRLYGHSWIALALAGGTIKVGQEETLPSDLVAYDRFLSAAPAMLGVEAGDAVLEMGSGIGERLVTLARASGWAVGVESEPRLAGRATENVRDNGVTAELVVDGWVEAIEVTAPRLLGRRPRVWVDCGRKELGQRLVDAVRGLDPRAVALQSENPVALCREVARWQRDGWTLAGFYRHEIDAETPFVDAVAVMASASAALPEKRAPRRKVARAP